MRRSRLRSAQQPPNNRSASPSLPVPLEYLAKVFTSSSMHARLFSQENSRLTVLLYTIGGHQNSTRGLMI